jgi:hypothetical protein
LRPSEAQPASLELPQTFAFATEQGELGLLQVFAFTDKPRGMKIRYKLVGLTGAELETAKTTP